MADDIDTTQGSDDSSDGYDSLDYDASAGDDGSSDDQGDDSWDYTADDGDMDNGGDGSDDSGDDGSSEDGGTTDAGEYSGYAGSAGDGGDQGTDSDTSWGLSDQATDSLGSGLGEIGHGAWEAAKGLGNAARDLGWGTLDAAGDITGRFEEAYHGLVDDQPALQADHAFHEGLKQAMRGRRENILRDLGIHDGERDPDPERTAGLNS